MKANRNPTFSKSARTSIHHPTTRTTRTRQECERFWGTGPPRTGASENGVTLHRFGVATIDEGLGATSAAGRPIVWMASSGLDHRSPAAHRLRRVLAKLPKSSKPIELLARDMVPSTPDSTGSRGDKRSSCASRTIAQTLERSGGQGAAPLPAVSLGSHTETTFSSTAAQPRHNLSCVPLDHQVACGVCLSRIRQPPLISETANQPAGSSPRPI